MLIYFFISIILLFSLFSFLSSGFSLLITISFSLSISSFFSSLFFFFFFLLFFFLFFDVCSFVLFPLRNSDIKSWSFLLSYFLFKLKKILLKKKSSKEYICSILNKLKSLINRSMLSLSLL